MSIAEEIQSLREEYRLRRAYFEQDGILEDYERQQLDEIASDICHLEQAYSKQNQTTTTTNQSTKTTATPKKEKADTHDKMTMPVEEGVGLTMSTDTEGNMSYGMSMEEDGASFGYSVNTNGVVTTSLGYKTEGEEGKSSVGLEFSSEGDFKGTAEHEFKNDVKASAEITNDSIQLALGKSWKMPEVSSWTYLLPPSPATFGLGVVLSARLNGSVGIEAKETINFAQGNASIGITTKGSLTGTVQVTGEALGIIQAGGNSSITATITGTGELVNDGNSISPNASITANLVLSFKVLIGLSESIISFAKTINVSRDDLTFEYPISSLELLKVVGVRISNGSVTGTPSFEPGKDLETVRSAINSGVQKIKNAWDRIKHYFDAAGNLIEGAAEKAGEVYDAAKEKVSDSLDEIGDDLEKIKEKISNIDLNPLD